MTDHLLKSYDPEDSARLQRALAHTRHERRDLFLLVRIEGCSHAQAAAIVGVREARARRQVSRAMLDLRRANRPQDFTLWQLLRPL